MEEKKRGGKVTTGDKQGRDRTQNELPIVDQPFEHIASSLKISEEEVVDKIQIMKNEGVIRRIGPVFDAKSLGYVSALFAVNVPESQEERAGEYISTFPGVTHNYKRDSEFNIWFTLVAENDESMDEIILNIEEKIKPQEILKLKSKKVFKIKGVFDVN